MKNKIVIIILFLLPLYIQAQDKWKPWGVSEAGFLAGSSGPSGDLRLQGGMKINGWLFGAGVAYDGYRFETIPVYGQVRKMFGAKKMKPFLMSSFGANFEMENDNPSSDLVFIRPGIWAPPVYSYTPGIYADLGMGLAFRTHRSFGYNLSFSYSRKTMTENSTYIIWNGSGAGEPTSSSQKFFMNRWAFRIAMQL